MRHRLVAYERALFTVINVIVIERVVLQAQPGRALLSMLVCIFPSARPARAAAALRAY